MEDEAMPWIVGLDEAGYGPNLGPLVQGAIALHTPTADNDIWQLLAHVIARAGVKRNDPRLIIDDSKSVYSSSSGLRGLERSVLATVGRDAFTLHELLNRLILADALADLVQESWFEGSESIPLEGPSNDGAEWAERFHRALGEVGFVLGPARGVITTASRFNAHLDRWGTKSAILAEGVISLMRTLHAELDDREPIQFLADKLGGRNAYAAIITEAFPEGWVQVIAEGAAESRYRVLGLDRDIEIRFCPRADGMHATVALASMLCKYTREVCMRQWNRWWMARVPGLKPTAGYPVDAARFLREIQPTIDALGIDMVHIWRRK